MSLGVPGLALVPEWITHAREEELLAAIDGSPWNTTLRRAVQHYGYRYDYQGRGVAESLGPLPDWAMHLASRLFDDGVFARVPDQVIVNAYEPGQGIAPHVDRHDFGEVVSSLSLGSDTTMTLSPRDTDGDAVDVRLPRRSLLVLQREARRAWAHGIAARKSDDVDGARVTRKRRVSITFRTLRALDEAGA
jgi:alkylated DNA repair dioxygenase AlkB